MLFEVLLDLTMYECPNLHGKALELLYIFNRQLQQFFDTVTHVQLLESPTAVQLFDKARRVLDRVEVRAATGSTPHEQAENGGAMKFAFRNASVLST